MKHSKAVGDWLAIYDNPMNEVVRHVRETILHADPRIKETIKGEAPTFAYRGTLASIFPESKKHVSLMVPHGAELPGHHPRLEGSGEMGRVMKLHSVADAHAAQYDLQHLARSWCDWRDAVAAESDEPKARAAKKPAAKKKPAPPKKAARPAGKKARPRKRAAGAVAKKSAKKASPRKRAARPASSARKRTASRSRAR